MALPLKKYPATASLLAMLFLLLAYRLTFYDYPDQRQLRNPIDFVCDVCGFSYHFVMLAVDMGQGISAPEYHARQALRYKPGESHLMRFIPSDGAKR